MLDAIRFLAVFLVFGGVVLAGLTIMAMTGGVSAVRSVKEIEADLKKQDFRIYYRAVKARTRLSGWMDALIKANDEFFRENPDYVEGAICGKLKEKQ